MGAVAVVGGYQVVRMEVAEKTKGWEKEPVLAAAADISNGETLTRDRIVTVDIPKKFAFESVVRPNELDAVIGQQVVGNIKKGEPIHWYQLRGNLEVDTLSKSLPKKARAITISVTERSSVGYMVRPSDHVDILGTFRDPSTNRMIAVTLLQNVIVLATGRTRANMLAGSQSSSSESFSTITLQVLPEEAEMLVLAQDLGNLYLTLRNSADADIYDEKARTTIDTLVTGERVRKVYIRRMNTIQRIKRVIRGLDKGKYPFDRK